MSSHVLHVCPPGRVQAGLGELVEDGGCPWLGLQTAKALHLVFLQDLGRSSDDH